MTYSLAVLPWRNATIALPASKSISNRALIVAALTPEAISPTNISKCDDTDALVSALRDMPDVIDVGASGSAMRFLTSYLSISSGEHTLTGTARMQQRPIRVLVDALRSLGAEITYLRDEGFPPLRIRGKNLEGGRIRVASDVSSQYISSLLMIAPTMRRGLTIELLGETISRSYIDLTLSIMQAYGAQAEWARVGVLEVQPQGYKPTPYYIESDWSAASYWYEMLSLTDAQDATLRLMGLTDSSRQGDAIARHIFSLLGVRTIFEHGETPSVLLRRSGPVVQTMVLDCSNCPDIAQTVVCACCGLGVPFDLTGLSTLTIKETDRLAALTTELRKLGFVVKSRDNNRLTWDGERCDPTMEALDTYDDHRMAMALAPLALRIEGVKINNPAVVSKSYPAFWQHIQEVAVKIEEV